MPSVDQRSVLIEAFLTIIAVTCEFKRFVALWRYPDSFLGFEYVPVGRVLLVLFPTGLLGASQAFDMVLTFEWRERVIVLLRADDCESVARVMYYMVFLDPGGKAQQGFDWSQKNIANAKECR